MKKRTYLLFAMASCAAFTSHSLRAQAAPPPDTPAEEDEELLELSPFVVSSTQDADNYSATATLGGSRIRTDLRDLPSSISIVTSKFLRDIGATDNQSLLQYTTNTEVGGLSGNYTGVGNTMVNGASESFATLVRPSSNTRVRGLDSADNTRDYFQTEVPWDSYNIDRVELQRGPNSILFGVGSPAGIVNTSTIQAGYKNGGKVDTRFSSFGSFRANLDYNFVVLPRELSFRVAALNDETKYRQKPAFNHDKRVFGTLRYDPRLLKRESAQTTIRASFEAGDISANRPRVLPPFDNITPFFYTPADSVNGENVINRRVFDPYYTQQYSLTGWGTSPDRVAWINGAMAGLQGTNNPVFAFNADSTSPITGVYQRRPNFYGTLGVNRDTGEVITDNGLAGVPFGAPVGIVGFNEYSRMAGLKGGNRGYYKDRVLTDPSIFDFFNKLIDGPNKHEWQKWKTFDTSIEQTFLDNRLAFQVAYNHQSYRDGYARNLGWSPSISIDINEYMMDYPSYAYPDRAVSNPNVGRAYVGGGSQNQGSVNKVERDHLRGIVTGELRAEDFLDRGSALTKFLGRHVLTGVFTTEEQKNDSRTFAPIAMEVGYADAIGFGAGGANQFRISDGNRAPDLITYLSGDVRDRSSAAGLNLSNIQAVQQPYGPASIKHWDSTWTPQGGVAPGDTWINPTALAGEDNVSFQAENPYNYAGWVDKSFNVLSAARGDINQLYADVSKLDREIDSMAFTWQGYLADGLIVPIYGWRQDKLTLRSRDAEVDPSTGAASTTDFIDRAPKSVKGDSSTWGVVVHAPKSWTAALPGNVALSAFYNDSSNSRVETRYSFSGRPLPDAEGTSRDYGVAISLLNDRLRFKVTRYESEVLNANLGGGEVGTLGNNTYYLYLQEAWGAARAVSNLAGIAGRSPGQEGAWNWALVENGWDWKYADPNGADFKNAPQTAREIAASEDWIRTMPDQAFFDAYGFAIDVAKIQSGNIDTMLSSFPAGFASNPNIGAVQASGKGRINGVYPTGTIDTTSKGWEFELVGEVTKNWNVSINASKTFASRDQIGAELVDWIEKTYERLQGPAGDLRLWWAGDSTNPMRSQFLSNIYAPYLHQVDSKGVMVPEMSPWRVNLTTNYSIDQGLLKGTHFGVSYRWQDGAILGYGLLEYENPTIPGVTEYKLDVNKPWWGEARDAVDLWVGYGRKITDKIHWHVQLNLRNVGENTHLVPISVQPDGSAAAFRIEEGMTWSVTNTFSF